MITTTYSRQLEITYSEVFKSAVNTCTPFQSCLVLCLCFAEVPVLPCKVRPHMRVNPVFGTQNDVPQRVYIKHAGQAC
jgi:hypothetical protein